MVRFGKSSLVWMALVLEAVEEHADVEAGTV